MCAMQALPPNLLLLDVKSLRVGSATSSGSTSMAADAGQQELLAKVSLVANGGDAAENEGNLPSQSAAAVVDLSVGRLTGTLLIGF